MSTNPSGVEIPPFFSPRADSPCLDMKGMMECVAHNKKEDTALAYRTLWTYSGSHFRGWSSSGWTVASEPFSMAAMRLCPLRIKAI